MKEDKIIFNNEKFIRISFMTSVISIIISLLLFSLNFFENNILIIILTTLIIIIILLLNSKIVFLQISKEAINISSQSLLYEFLGSKKNELIIEYSYLCKFEITYCNPTSIIVLFIHKNGNYYYKKIPLTFFSKKSIESLEIQIMRKIKWYL